MSLFYISCHSTSQSSKYKVKVTLNTRFDKIRRHTISYLNHLNRK